jgi:ATP-binding cassette subfamily C protein LapB
MATGIESIVSAAEPLSSLSPPFQHSFWDDLRRVYSLRRYFLRNLPVALLSLAVTSVEAYTAAGGINLLQLAVNGINVKAQEGRAFDKAAFLVHEDLRRLVHGREDFFSRLLVNGAVVDTLLISIALMALAILLRFLRDFLRSKVTLRLRHQLREDVLEGLIHEPAEIRRQRPEGTTSEIFRSDVDATSQLMVFGVLSGLESLYLVVYFSFQVAQTGGWYILPLFFLITLVSQGGVELLTRRAEQAAMSGSYTAQQTAAAQSNRFFRLFNELLARGGEKREGQRVVSAWDLAARLNTRFALWAGARGAGNETLQQFVMPIILISIVYKEQAGPQMMGGIIAVSALLGQITTPFSALIATPSMLLQFRPSLRSITGMLGYAKQNPESEDVVALRDNRQPAEVTLEDVTVAFGPASEPILRSISLTLPAGKRVGLIGKSGSGKTTLGRILAGEQIPSHGRVLIDGVDITEWPFVWRRQLVGLLYAEPGFLLDTLLANVHFGREVREAQFARACQVSGVDQIAARHNRGWQEPITPDVQLSSGEKRKVGLARFLASPHPYRLLVFDEPFANVDAAGIRDLAERVAEATEGTTSLIITHDPDVIKTDFNIFLKLGRIEGIGTHDELMKANADYAQLVRRDNEPTAG